MLRQVKIKNFQSIRDLQYDFIDGLNVIVAENGTGKSILNKIITFLVNYNKYTANKRKQFIRFGCAKSDIFFSSDDDSYWVEIFSNNINYYRRVNGKYEFESNDLPQGLISMLSLLVSSNGFIGNLITSEQSKLLVDSEDKINTEIMSLVVSDENAELVISTCEERLKEINSEIRTKVAVRDSLERELSKIEVVNYQHIEDSVNRVFTSIDFLETLVTASEILDRVNSVGHVSNVMEEAIDMLALLEHSIETLEKVHLVDEVSFDEEELSVLSELVTVNDKITNILYKKSMVTEVKPTKVTEGLLGLMTKLEKIQFSLNEISYIDLPGVERIESLSRLEEIFETVDRLSDLMNVTSELKEENDRLKLELDSYGGEDYDCPIYGTIKFVNEECIRIS